MKKIAGTLLLSCAFLTMHVRAQTNHKPEVEVVNRMFQAFGTGNMDALKMTLSDSTLWVYHGSPLIPYAGSYRGKEAVVRFIGNIVSNVDIIDFSVGQVIANGKTVVVLGAEKQKIKKSSRVLEQQWVQVYTVENGLITRMEEFANTAYAEQFFK